MIDIRMKNGGHYNEFPVTARKSPAVSTPKSSNARAIPSSSSVPVMCDATAFSASQASPIATAQPTAANISTSFRPSPNANVLLRGKTERGAGVPDAARLAAVGMKHIYRAGMTAHRAVAPAVLGKNRLQRRFLRLRRQHDELMHRVFAVI